MNAPPPVQQSYPSNHQFCTQCHHVGIPKTETKGSILIEIILWLFFLVPGLIYSIWRLTTRGKVCRQCGAKELIPPTSPRAQQLLGH